ncbi:MAG: hypothetical protein CVU12_01970 [Bacteroidetes bacterium HGW-Bacteroidetes-7]|jgi:hypothetical protein|nr:MAG: hypothetical protein CVU12_01970 [Bacteroidetes bacterium HGW-Bacteroidetes-7]
MDLKNLTSEQRKALLEQLKAEEIAEAQRKKDDQEAYKSLVDETVKKAFPKLIGISEKLAKNKADIREAFRKAIEIKKEVYGVKDLQQSHTFSDAQGQFKITIGVYTIDNYDDTVDVGILMVRECITGLGKDDDSKALIETILKLLSKDKKGTLKPSRVLQLEQLANRLGNETFLEGVRIIKDAYKPLESKSFVRAEYKDENGSWVNVPLGMTEA